MTIKDKHVMEANEIISNVLVFKTSIQDEHDIDKIAPVLDTDSRVQHWNVDLLDIDNVLRIESNTISAHEIIEQLETSGFSCEELPD
jgi:tRNA G26 N,N-dimethylase Trm1